MRGFLKCFFCDIVHAPGVIKNRKAAAIPVLGWLCFLLVSSAAWLRAAWDDRGVRERFFFPVTRCSLHNASVLYRSLWILLTRFAATVYTSAFSLLSQLYDCSYCNDEPSLVLIGCVSISTNDIGWVFTSPHPPPMHSGSLLEQLACLRLNGRRQLKTIGFVEAGTSTRIFHWAFQP